MSADTQSGQISNLDKTTTMATSACQRFCFSTSCEVNATVGPAMLSFTTDSITGLSSIPSPWGDVKSIRHQYNVLSSTWPIYTLFLILFMTTCVWTGWTFACATLAFAWIFSSSLVWAFAWAWVTTMNALLVASSTLEPYNLFWSLRDWSNVHIS